MVDKNAIWTDLLSKTPILAPTGHRLWCQATFFCRYPNCLIWSKIDWITFIFTTPWLLLRRWQRKMGYHRIDSVFGKRVFNYNWSFVVVCLFRIYSAVYGPTDPIDICRWESNRAPDWQGARTSLRSEDPSQNKLGHNNSAGARHLISNFIHRNHP